MKQDLTSMTISEMNSAIRRMSTTLRHCNTIDPDARAMITDMVIQMKTEVKTRTAFYNRTPAERMTK